MKSKLISFIIPHKGREQFLLKTIESVIAQQFDLALIEIVVITQNDELSEHINRLKKLVSLTVFTRPTSETISSLRNYGVSKTSGIYLAFLDADIYLSDNWVQSMMNTLNAIESRVITSAMQINSAEAPPLEKIRTALSNAVLDQNVSFLPGRNLFLTRDTFNKIGGFPDHLITCEDYYFTDRANQLGDLYYTSEASYIHLGEDKDFTEMYKKEIWRGQSNLLSIKGRTIPLNEIPSFIIPVGLLLLVLITIIAAAANYQVIALLSFAAFLIPIAVYSGRLFILAGNKVSLFHTLKFYLFYFPARAIGTIGGLFKTFTTKSHT